MRKEAAIIFLLRFCIFGYSKLQLQKSVKTSKQQRSISKQTLQSEIQLQLSSVLLGDQ